MASQQNEIITGVQALTLLKTISPNDPEHAEQHREHETDAGYEADVELEAHPDDQDDPEDHDDDFFGDHIDHDTYDDVYDPSVPWENEHLTGQATSEANNIAAFGQASWDSDPTFWSEAQHAQAMQRMITLASFPDTPDREGTTAASGEERMKAATRTAIRPTTTNEEVNKFLLKLIFMGEQCAQGHVDAGVCMASLTVMAQDITGL